MDMINYFLLDITNTDRNYARASRIAMSHFAAEIRHSNPKMADELVKRIDEALNLEIIKNRS